MKGVIFTAFLELVESKWGIQMVDEIITDANDPIDGSYNSINYYPHKQLVNLVVSLSKHSKVSAQELMTIYGEYLFDDLAASSPDLISEPENTFELLANIEVLIHTEVRKLYPEANPPKFEHLMLSNQQMELTYFSHRSMSSVAIGLIRGCAKHFGENVEIEVISKNDDATQVKFLLTKKD